MDKKQYRPLGAAALSSSRLIAFYGSLRAGDPAYCDLRIDRFLRYIGAGQIEGKLYDLGDYPGLVPGRGLVRGDLFECRDTRVLRLLDEYEEFYPTHRNLSLFIRTRVRLIEPRVSAWIYRYNRPHLSAPVIESGDWLSHKRQHTQQRHSTLRASGRWIMPRTCAMVSMNHCSPSGLVPGGPH